MFSRPRLSFIAAFCSPDFISVATVVRIGFTEPASTSPNKRLTKSMTTFVHGMKVEQYVLYISHIASTSRGLCLLSVRSLLNVRLHFNLVRSVVVIAFEIDP